MKATIIVTVIGIPGIPTARFKQDLSYELSQLVNHKETQLEIFFISNSENEGVFNVESRCEKYVKELDMFLLKREEVQLAVYKSLKKYYTVKRLVFTKGSNIDFLNQHDFNKNFKQDKLEGTNRPKFNFFSLRSWRDMIKRYYDELED